MERQQRHQGQETAPRCEENYRTGNGKVQGTWAVKEGDGGDGFAGVGPACCAHAHTGSHALCRGGCVGGRVGNQRACAGRGKRLVGEEPHEATTRCGGSCTVASRHGQVETRSLIRNSCASPLETAFQGRAREF
jgi:hypothetical protein